MILLTTCSQWLPLDMFSLSFRLLAFLFHSVRPRGIIHFLLWNLCQGLGVCQSQDVLHFVSIAHVCGNVLRVSRPPQTVPAKGWCFLFVNTHKVSNEPHIVFAKGCIQQSTLAQGPKNASASRPDIRLEKNDDPIFAVHAWANTRRQHGPTNDRARHGCDHRPR